jgi:hypothetical protein
MSYAPYFELVTELQTLIRRDFPYTGVTPNAPGILDPNNANPLIDGEWLELDTGTNQYNLKRGSGEGTSLLQFPVHTERGRYDVQAAQKVNVLFLGMYEADTLVVDTTGLAVGDLLSVQDVTVGALTRRGLKERAANTGTVVGFVTKVVGSKVRFVHYANTKLA